MVTRRFLVTVLVILLLVLLPMAALAKGGHTEPTGNNLSFPVIWSEGIDLSLPGTMLQASLTVPYTGSQIEYCADGALAYAQKTEGNIWQAENSTAGGSVVVNEIDWGDSLESVDMKVGRPVRIELSLYKLLETPMTGYTMVMLDNPSSPDEVQGVCATGDPLADNGAAIYSYSSYEATVYTPTATLIIQKITGSALSWDATLSQWIGDVTAPLSITFAGELNVGGKVIYGLSQGGWKPTSIGDYRITFILPVTGKTLFDGSTIIRLSEETEALAAEGDGEVGGEAYVDPANNLTYIDITVVGGGGGR